MSERAITESEYKFHTAKRYAEGWRAAERMVRNEAGSQFASGNDQAAQRMRRMALKLDGMASKLEGDAETLRLALLEERNV